MRTLPFASAVVRSSKLGCSRRAGARRLDQTIAQVERRERQRERRADEAAADDGAIAVSRDGVGSLMRRITRSISAAVRGRPAVSTS